jgi:hypothetical protein
MLVFALFNELCGFFCGEKDEPEINHKKLFTLPFNF